MSAVDTLWFVFGLLCGAFTYHELRTQTEDEPHRDDRPEQPGPVRRR